MISTKWWSTITYSHDYPIEGMYKKSSYTQRTHQFVTPPTLSSTDTSTSSWRWVMKLSLSLLGSFPFSWSASLQLTTTTHTRLDQSQLCCYESYSKDLPSFGRTQCFQYCDTRRAWLARSVSSTQSSLREKCRDTSTVACRAARLDYSQGGRDELTLRGHPESL